MIRPVEPSDFPAVADLLTRLGPERVDDDELEDELRRDVPGKLVRRWLIDEDGRPVGTAFVVRYPSQPPGVFQAGIAVEPARRRRGLGRALFDEVERVAYEHGATHLRTEIREDERDGLAFAGRRGFEVLRRSVRAKLDLTSFEPPRVAHYVERVERAGIELRSLAELGVDDKALRRLYAINRIATAEDPASLDGTFPSFETWRGLIVERDGFQPEGQLLALDGGRYVGLSAFSVDAEARTAETLVTGVDRDYRGRGIGTALKAKVLTLAREAGATATETEMDTRNEAMIAINRKLGYVLEPGYAVLGATLRVREADPRA